MGVEYGGRDMAGSSPLSMYAAVVGIGLGCTTALVAVYELTRPVIEARRSAFRHSAVLKVLPGAVRSEPFRWAPDGGFRRLDTAQDGAAADLFAGYDDQDQLVGLALETQGQGYQETIRILYGYDPNRQVILAFAVLESRETPGLGDRIESDPKFLSNFGQLDVRLSDDGQRLANPILWVSPGDKSDPWQIDGITGATVTTRAIAHMLNTSSQLWLPRIRLHADDFAGPASIGIDLAEVP